MEYHSAPLIFSAHIDFDARNYKDVHLSKRKPTQYLTKNNNILVAGDSDWDKVLNLAKMVIEHGLARELILPPEFANIRGARVESEYITDHEGSLIILFGIVLTSYEIIYNYKAFYESYDLIRSQCQSVLNKVFEKQLPASFDVSVTYEGSGANDQKGNVSPQWSEKLKNYMPNSSAPSQFPGRRDGFFYYLLCLNIILLIIIAVLVFKAVNKTYFM